MEREREITAAFRSIEPLAWKWLAAGGDRSPEHRLEVYKLRLGNPPLLGGYKPSKAPDPITWEP